MRGVGLEPTHKKYQILSLARLPIPPLSRIRMPKIEKRWGKRLNGRRTKRRKRAFWKNRKFRGPKTDGTMTTCDGFSRRLSHGKIPFVH